MSRNPLLRVQVPIRLLGKPQSRPSRGKCDELAPDASSRLNQADLLLFVRDGGILG